MATCVFGMASFPSPLTSQTLRTKQHARCSANAAPTKSIDTLVFDGTKWQQHAKAYRGISPVRLQIPHPVWASDYATLSERLSPKGLVASPMADDPLCLLLGEDDEGNPRRGEQTNLRSLLATTQDNAVSRQSRAYAYLNILYNAKGTVRFMDWTAPNGLAVWESYISPCGPKWPTTLLQDDDGGYPRTNETVVLALGTGPGAPYRYHDANLYLQVHGRTAWAFFSPTDFKVFLAGAPPPGAQLLPIAPDFKEALQRYPWALSHRRDLPQPRVCISQLGDILYIPSGWVHATWDLVTNKQTFTAALTLRGGHF